jgi:hypothetical protein
MQIPAKFRGAPENRLASDASAFAQAATESTLLGRLSSTTTIKAGSTLGSALNHTIKQLAGAFRNQLRSRRRRKWEADRVRNFQSKALRFATAQCRRRGL